MITVDALVKLIPNGKRWQMVEGESKIHTEPSSLGAYQVYLVRCDRSVSKHLDPKKVRELTRIILLKLIRPFRNAFSY
jgi:hypothetical protein